jgi:hypothetical protein
MSSKSLEFHYRSRYKNAMDRNSVIDFVVTQTIFSLILSF